MTEQTTQEEQTPTSPSISLQQINTIVSGVLVAQKRGAYTLEESGILAEPVRLVSQFVKVASERIEANAKATEEATNAPAQETPPATSTTSTTTTMTTQEESDESAGPQLVISEKY